MTCSVAKFLQRSLTTSCSGDFALVHIGHQAGWNLARDVFGRVPQTLHCLHQTHDFFELTMTILLGVLEAALELGADLLREVELFVVPNNI